MRLPGMTQEGKTSDSTIGAGISLASFRGASLQLSCRFYGASGHRDAIGPDGRAWEPLVPTEAGGTAANWNCYRLAARYHQEGQT